MSYSYFKFAFPHKKKEFVVLEGLRGLKGVCGQEVEIKLKD